MAKENKAKNSADDILLDLNLLNETLTNNSREILRSISREEINSVLQESFEDEEEDIDLDIDNAGEGSDDMAVDTVGDEEAGASEFETEPEMGGGLDVDSEEGSEDYTDMEGMASGEDDYEFDLSTATDDQVISVFKKLQDNDEVEVISNDEVHITDPESGSEYQIKMGGGSAAPTTDIPDAPATDEFDIDSEVSDTMDIPSADAGMGMDDMGAEDDMDVEIELDGEEDYEEEDDVNEDIVRGAGHDKHLTDASMPSGDIEGQTAEKDADSGDNLDGGFKDNAVKHANAEGPMVMEDEEEEEEEINEDELEEGIAVGIAQKKAQDGKKAKMGRPGGAGAGTVFSESDYRKLLEQHKALMQENESFKAGLKKFRNVLNEVTTFNSNLTYATRLFTEHSTTREEKREILKRFDNEAVSMKESKMVFKNIQEGLKKRTPLNETINNKINAEPKTPSKSQINESTAYEDASTKRMRDLMKRMNK